MTVQGINRFEEFFRLERRGLRSIEKIHLPHGIFLRQTEKDDSRFAVLHAWNKERADDLGYGFQNLVRRARGRFEKRRSLHPFRFTRAAELSIDVAPFRNHLVAAHFLRRLRRETRDALGKSFDGRNGTAERT